MKHLKLSESTFEPREGYERAVLLASDDFGANVKVQLMKISPAGGIKAHHHDVRTECIRIVSGDGTIKVNGEVAASSEDDLVLIEPGDVHEFINNSASEPFTFLVIRANDPGNEDMIFEEA